MTASKGFKRFLRQLRTSVHKSHENHVVADCDQNQQTTSEAVSLKQNACNAAMKTVFEAERSQLKAYAYAIVLDLRYRGVLSQAQLVDFRRKLVKHAGSKALVDDLINVLLVTETDYFVVLHKLLRDLDLDDVANKLNIEYEKQQNIINEYD